MKKNKFYVFIVIVIAIIVFGSTLSCVSEAQLENIIDRYPRLVDLANTFVIFAGDWPDEDDYLDNWIDEKIINNYKGTYEDFVKEEEEKAWDVILEDIRKPYEVASPDEIIKIIGTTDDFKPIKSTPIATSATISAIQSSIISGYIDSSNETTETTATQEQEKKGSITLTGSIESPYSLSPLELVIDLDTGVFTGSFTGVYEYEGFESEYYTDPSDTANGVADLSGTVELKTGALTGAGALEYTWQNAGTGETWPFAVEGTLSADYKSAEGEFIFGEQGVWPWTATAQ